MMVNIYMIPVIHAWGKNLFFEGKNNFGNAVSNTVYDLMLSLF